jgi:hypothetical protein
MKIRIQITILLIVVLLNAKAQYQAANWPMQYNDLVLKITTDTFEIDSLPDCPYTIGCSGPVGFIANSSISDSAGKLLLFSFGEDIRNKYGGLVAGGTEITYGIDLPGDSSNSDGWDPHSQGALFLPRPGSATQFYLFIKDWDSTYNGQPSRVTATLTDITANNDSGKVLRATQVIMQGNMLSDARMTACQHANGRDWWLINHQYLTNVIYTHLITPDSIYGPFEQSIGLPGLEPDDAGWSIFSPEGSTFATATEGMGAITLLDFDRCSGTFSNFRQINTVAADSGNYFNLAFSLNGRFLYASDYRYLEQYDLEDSDINASRVQLVHDTAGFPLIYQMVLMPNGKIYQVGFTVIDSMLSVIDSPDVKGLGCGFHLRSVLVANSLEMTNVPNFPTYNLGPVKGSACDTLNTGIITPTQGENSIRVFPIPAADNVNIITSLNPDESGIIELYNIEGVKMREIQVTGGTITSILQIDNLADGVYLYYLHTNQQYYARGKLVIAK